MYKYTLALFILSSAFITGCGKFSSAGVSPEEIGGLSLAAKSYGTCDRKLVPTFNICTEANGPDYNDQGYLDILQSSCESTGGVFSTNNCDKIGSLGTCIAGPGQTNETHVTYYSPQFDAASAQAACQSAGGVYFAQ
jgi:hypothetical protein